MLQLSSSSTNVTWGVYTSDIKTLRIYNFTVHAKAKGGSISTVPFYGSLEVYSECEDDNITLSTRSVTSEEQLHKFYEVDQGTKIPQLVYQHTFSGSIFEIDLIKRFQSLYGAKCIFRNLKISYVQDNSGRNLSMGLYSSFIKTSLKTKKLQIMGSAKNIEYERLKIYLKAKTDYREGGDQQIPLVILSLAQPARINELKNNTELVRIKPLVITNEEGAKGASSITFKLGKVSDNTKNVTIKNLGLINYGYSDWFVTGILLSVNLNTATKLLELKVYTEAVTRGNSSLSNYTGLITMTNQYGKNSYYDVSVDLKGVGYVFPDEGYVEHSANGSLTAKITSISQFGDVVVNFSRPIIFDGPKD